MNTTTHHTTPHTVCSAGCAEHRAAWHRFRIANMDCASEESEIRRALEGVRDLDGLQFNLGERTLTFSAVEPALSQALHAIRQAGFHPEALDAQAEASPATPQSGFWTSWGQWIAALVLAMLAEGLNFVFPEEAWAKVLGMGVAVAAIALSGFSVYGKGVAALKQGRLNINALMTVAVTGAFLIGQWPEAAMVMALYALAEAIEARAVDRARHAIKSLLSLTPEQAEVRQDAGQAAGSGSDASRVSWVRADVNTIAVGSIIRIRPGERIALDGHITQGHSAIDQSPVTGESLPVDKTVGDAVYAGTINQSAALEIQVTAPASDSTLARIIQAVEQAQSTRAPTQRFVDQFAAIYTPAVFILAVLVALLAPWLLGVTWLQALYKALVLLVIACPCALVISTPVTVVSGLAAGARRGILLKGGVYLEDARNIRVVALDKTGTLTQGKPQLVAFEALNSDAEDGGDGDDGGSNVGNASYVSHVRDLDPVNRPTLESMAKSLASRSDHPVSKAITAGLNHLADPAQEVNAFQALPGRGIQGVIQHRPYALINHRWIEERGLCSPELEVRLSVHEQAGRTVTFLASEQRVLALCAVADTLKPSSTQAVAELKALGVKTVMLTGDNSTTARTVGAQAGMDEVHGDLLPEDKLRIIGDLQQRFGTTAMTGDGINDAPALAKAHIGFAMGAVGTHTAMEAADVLIMNDDLRRLPETIRLSQRTHTVLWQNIALALGIKLAFLWLAVFDNASMWMAVFADMGASLLVVFNGLRLLKPTQVTDKS